MKKVLEPSISLTEEMQAGEMEGKYLTFWTDGQLFGVPIAYVVQIVGMQAVTEIPEYPPYAKGVINLRGTVIPVIDMRLRLGKPEADYTERTCIIVASIHNQDCGFIVDGVDAVTDIPDAQISPPPQMGGDTTSRYLTGLGRLEEGEAERIVLLIDTAKVLGSGEFDRLVQAVQ